MKAFKPRALVLCALLIGVSMAAVEVHGQERLRKALKGAGVVVLTKVLAERLDKFVNTVTLNRSVPTTADTKVVPVISVGEGTKVGAVQVTGPKEAVEQVKAVMRIDDEFKDGKLGVEVLVPTSSLRPRKFDRVEGVGISALIDIDLDD